MKRKFIYAVILMGFSGLVAQIVLLRELMVAFHGNELSIGVVLANWLLLESAGAYFLGKKISEARRKRGLFILVTVLFTIFFLAAIYAVRIFKEFLTVVPGEGLGIMPMFYVSFLILLPVSLLHGALFTSGCKLYFLYSSFGAMPDSVATASSGSAAPSVPAKSDGAEAPQGATESNGAAGLSGAAGSSAKPSISQDKQSAFSIARVYIYETVGTIAGGLLLTYLFIPWLHSIQIALVLALLNFIVCLFLIKPFWHPQVSSGIRATGIFLTGLLLITIYLLAGPGADRIHFLSVERQWKGQQLVHYQNSNYGNIVVVEREQEYTFFSDGLPVITTPNPDVVYVEEFVHFPMLSHPAPHNILVLSGGAGGVINEILKHDVHRIDYAEIDPQIPEVINKFPTPLTDKEFKDQRVNIKYLDGRFFLKRTDGKFDIILSGFTDPSTLQTNRFFTREFFSLAENRLTPDGILVLGLPGSLTYLSPEMADLNAMVLNTLENVFPYIRVIPGDGINLYLASRSQEVMETGHAEMAERAETRELDLKLITPGYLEYRMHPRWSDWFMTNIEDRADRINEDFKPLGVFYSLIYWNEKFSPSFNKFFRQSEKIDLYLLAAFFLLITLFILLISSLFNNYLKPALFFCIVSTGFAGMLFDLILIFAFQVLYGYIFYWLGLLVTAFMAGVMVGGLWMTAYLKKVETTLPVIIKLELGLVVFAFLLPWIFLKAGPLLIYTWFDNILRVVFLLLSFGSGLLVGAQFPLANKEYLKISPNLSGTAGLLYSADLWGGWLGGILGGVVLLPVLGLMETSIVVIMFKISSLVLLIVALKR